MIKRSILSGFFVFLVACHPALAAVDVAWYATHGLAEKPISLELGGGAQSISLQAGWKCSISATSPAFARQVLCENGDKKVEFSVQCDATRPKDRIQLRFKNVADRYVDHIEVGCEHSSNA